MQTAGVLVTLAVLFLNAEHTIHCAFFLSLYSEGGIPVLSLKKRLNEVCSLNPSI